MQIVREPASSNKMTNCFNGTECINFLCSHIYPAHAFFHLFESGEINWQNTRFLLFLNSKNHIKNTSKKEKQTTIFVYKRFFFVIWCFIKIIISNDYIFLPKHFFLYMCNIFLYYVDSYVFSNVILHQDKGNNFNASHKKENIFLLVLFK